MKSLKFLGSLLLLAVLVLSGCESLSPRPKVPPRLGLQAYTFRNSTFAETLAKAQAAGIQYLQAYNGQTLGGGLEGKFGHQMDEATRTRVLELARSHGVTLVSYGVITGKDEADWRAIFAFAQAMGLEQIASEPPPDALKLVDRLSEESGIEVALHNHPTPSVYADPEFALKQAKRHGRNVGLCADTGHWVRSGHDPVESLRKAKGRIIELHFKDLTERGVKSAHDVPWGLGASQASAQVRELKRQGFSGYVFIEYEHDTPALESDVARSAEFFRRALAASEDELARNAVVPPQYTARIEETWGGQQGKDSKRWAPPQPLLAADLGNAEFTPGSWAWDNGVLVARGGGDLWTRESYGDFALSLEFRCSEGTNSGVFLRCSDPADWLHTAIEVQILQGDAENDKHLVGSLFDVLAPTRQIQIEPGQWHRYVIVAKGSRITVSLDGEEIVKADLNQWTEPHKNPDGTPNKFNTAYKDMARSGRIGLQYHGSPVEFRNLVVERLAPPPPAPAK